MNTDERQQLASMATALEQATRRVPFDSENWALDIPTTGGVYALWRRPSGAMVYVGETSSLRHRMQDLGRSVNHTCRRKLAEKHRMVGAPEPELSAVIAKHYLVSYLPVALGRAELEEYLTLRHRRTLLNSPSLRHKKGSAYDWVEELE
jgi:hypothetical protein